MFVASRKSTEFEDVHSTDKTFRIENAVHVQYKKSLVSFTFASYIQENTPEEYVQQKDDDICSTN